jgi:hypothetical protein
MGPEWKLFYSYDHLSRESVMPKEQCGRSGALEAKNSMYIEDAGQFHRVAEKAGLSILMRGRIHSFHTNNIMKCDEPVSAMHRHCDPEQIPVAFKKQSPHGLASVEDQSLTRDIETRVET